MAELVRSLERQRRDAAPLCRDGAGPDKAPNLNGPKPFFLDRHLIMQLARNGAVSVLWPRPKTSTNAPMRRLMNAP